MAKSKFRWLKMRKKTDPELPLKPPGWLGNHSNGEYFHEQTPHEKKLEAMILQKADENARRLGMDRREFLASSMGMATTLWVVNACKEEGPESPNGHCVTEEMTYDEDAACAALSGDEFIFDIQTHHFNPDGEWVRRNPTYMEIVPRCGADRRELCMSRERFEELVFCESDTTMIALSTWPAALCTETRRAACGLPLPNEDVAASRDLINMSANSQRVVNHCQLMPNDPAGIQRQLDIMEEMHCNFGIAAWKLYPAWGPNNVGFFLDDETYGIPIIEKGIELGVKTFCIHKGLPIPGFDVQHNFPHEIGRVAKMYPDCKFIIYHSAICAGQSNFCVSPNEGPYDPNNATAGSNTLIKALEEAGVEPGSNVYGELGSAYSQVRRNPTQAQHFIGKLMKHLGPNNVCWGTDAIIGGSPQDLIEDFRMLEISDQFQNEFGYPALDDRQRRRIFGLNAAEAYGVDAEAIRCQLPKCSMAQNQQLLNEEIGGRRWTVRSPLGPKTRREFLRLAKEHKDQGVPS